jgi:hypothetical protein
VTARRIALAALAVDGRTWRRCLGPGRAIGRTGGAAPGSTPASSLGPYPCPSTDRVARQRCASVCKIIFEGLPPRQFWEKKEENERKEATDAAAADR